MKIEPAASIEGAIAVPGVKGISQRAVLLGAIADGESRIDGFGRAADTETALSVVRQLGAEVDDDGSETIRVRGVGLRGLRAPDAPLDFGNAGTVLRLAAGILAGQEGRFELVGDESLSSAAPGADRRASAADGRPRGDDRRARAGRDRGRGPEADPLSAADGERAGQVGGAPRRAARGRRRDARRRAASDARPHRAPAPRARRVGAEARLRDLRFAGRPACRRSTSRIAGRLLVGRAVRRSPRRSSAGRSSSSTASTSTRCGRASSTCSSAWARNIAVFNRRTAGGEPVADLEVRSAPLTATQVDAGEVPRLIDELPAVRARRRARPRRDGRPRRRGAARKGNGPDRNRDNFAERPWRADRGEP